MNTQIRVRTEDDLGECVAIANEVRRCDGYPTHVPSNMRVYVQAGDVLGAWVALRGNAIAGHVALCPSTKGPAAALACASTQIEPAQIAVVARLFVAPSARRFGIGTRLLKTAVSEADGLHLRSILDVSVKNKGAIAMYLALGWTNLGPITSPYPGGKTLRQFVFLAPAV